MRGTCFVLVMTLVGCGTSSSSTSVASDGAVDATLADASSSDVGSLDEADATSPDASNHDAAPPSEASSTDAISTAETGGCGVFTGDTTPTCSPDGTQLGVCTPTGPHVTDCSRGCLRAGSDGLGPACLGDAGSNDWSCNGSYGTTRATDGDYYLTEFGCYVDSSGTVQTDPDDNCIPSCLSKAIAAGLCPPGSTGPACEESLNWYTADGARFGCLQRLRVSNPANGNEVIAIALDFGPGCSGETKVGKAVLDSSGPINTHLFGGAEGVSDHALVHVVEVDDTTPLGIVK